MSSNNSQDILTSSFKFITVLSLLFVMFTAQGVISLGSILGSSPADASTIEVWWPTESARISGTQPFKALLQGYSVNDYKMYWSVDGGNKNLMQTSHQDYPHKETAVDVSGWNWRGEGPYQIGFTATDKAGNKLSEYFVPVYIEQTDTGNTPASDAEPVINATHSEPEADNSDNTSTADPVSKSINVWWPTNGVEVSGTQPLKAVVKGKKIREYDMYWKIGSGSKNKMEDSWQDWPHKESTIDLSSWTWLGRGPYVIELLAYSKNSNDLIAKGNTSIYVTQSSEEAATEPIPSSSADAGDELMPVSSPINRPADGSLYVDAYSPARSHADSIRSYDPYHASLLDKIASQSTARWFGGWNADVYSDVKNLVDAASAQGALASLVAYNIPQRDCGSYSAGGSGSPDHYKQWISAFAQGIGNRRAIVILEPDAITGMDCLSGAGKEMRMSLIQHAVDTLKSTTQASVYIDAGHANWLAPETAASRLNWAGIARADGFSLNVSNYVTTSDNVRYGKTVSSMLGGEHFVVDTSRNGLGPNGSEWCNPGGRALGNPPTTSTGDNLIDAYLWIKVPGESDGTCNGGPSAGVFWPEYAIGLAERAQW